VSWRFFRPLACPDLCVIQPPVFADDRGFFYERYHAERFKLIGIDELWVQENISVSAQGVLRGLHGQTGVHSQAKLVSCLAGEVWDVVVDLRPASPSFNRWFSWRLNAQNRLMIYIPRGFAHGFYSLQKDSMVIYQTSQFYQPTAEQTWAYNHPDWSIPWPFIAGVPLILSPKDAVVVMLKT
jgi:dTDP-4-dehydrorhamnose 3,5-epimerase